MTDIQSYPFTASALGSSHLIQDRGALTSPKVMVRFGEQRIDITELGDLLIKAGTDINAIVKPGRTDD